MSKRQPWMMGLGDSILIDESGSVSTIILQIVYEICILAKIIKRRKQLTDGKIKRTQLSSENSMVRLINFCSEK